MEKQYFTIEEALEDIKTTLEEGYDGDYGDLFDEVFNTDYYICYTSEAEKALAQYGTFKAIGKVQQYEQDNFGDINTDLTDPTKVANMLYYIIGQQAIDQLDTLNDVWNERATEETNQTIVAEIDEMLESEVRE